MVPADESHLVPSPLPDELKDWDNIEDESLFRKPWEHYELFLAQHGYTLLGAPAYDDPQVFERIPRRPALNPFFPKDDEDFVHRPVFMWEEVEYLRLPQFFQPRATLYLGLDKVGRQVLFKAVTRDSAEYKVLSHLRSHNLRQDPRNHTIPATLVSAGDMVFVIQPYWGRCWDWPSPDSVTARFKIVFQLLEGLVFMHENRVGHGDIHRENILWNHSDCRGWTTGEHDPPPGYLFHSTFDFRMAYIDFGCSTLLEPGQSRMVPSNSRPPSDFAAPEQTAEGDSYDVFAADVYNLGKVLQWELEEALKHDDPVARETVESAPDYLDLLRSMTQEDPARRPSSLEAHITFRAIFKNWELTRS
ncbi:hypothetical protein GLOTRDRAFT_130116 [Gloeophyllum trabeum ATCC 11539]|uniref:Protein kinase domain-containing protein n=1 Tax=Gloeophyllum trabeum (strain ATCC 11539 / FP-39264 / Madison 617) TaxID=670483 RepID=S7Q5J3_GLOTA|nr:uncharacterized protein GLOTRDRAFT_130116 [Gloeophyllum trabeum ATCC 11539]EPQ54762.1 hypothetical protein GLOTRDRAFT_130116 [Gloeophyllum trabeum ATCC 11539]